MPKELIAAGAPLAADVEMERQGRMEALKTVLLEQIAAGRGAEVIDQVLGSMMALERENERLAWRVLRADRYRFGRSSEKLSSEELGQLFLALGGESDALKDAGAEAQSVPAPAAPEQTEPPDAAVAPGAEPGDTDDSEVEAPEPQGKKRRRVQQMSVDSTVERNVQAATLLADERACSLCGRDKIAFDHVEHELIRFVPAKIVVDVKRREKAGCPIVGNSCRGSSTAAAVRRAPRGRLSARRARHRQDQPRHARRAAAPPARGARAARACQNPGVLLGVHARLARASGPRDTVGRVRRRRRRAR